MDPRGQSSQRLFGAALQAAIGAFLFSSLCGRAKGQLTVLLWNPPGDLDSPAADCCSSLGIRGCHVTTDRAWYSSADAVVVAHGEAGIRRQELPLEPRPLHQRWVWFSLTPPTFHPVPPSMDGLFNLTMSYRSDSDIFAPYGWLEAVHPPREVTAPPKSRLVAWVASARDAASDQVAYFEELRKFLHVDIYGESHTPKEHLIRLLSRHKFYLAFEDSRHRDYITEKLWRDALVSGTVPVVRGPSRKNYERFLPPEAFIHVDDFPNASALAAFLHELDSDHERYRRFFQWRERLRPVSAEPLPHRLCRVCPALWENPRWYRAVPELTRWFR